jgi:hypothetical protein
VALLVEGAEADPEDIGRSGRDLTSTGASLMRSRILDIYAGYSEYIHRLVPLQVEDAYLKIVIYFAIACRITRSTSSGKSGRTELGSGNDSVMCLITTAIGVSVS